MKFGDILGEMHLNEELSDHYKKVAHKVKLMYKTLRIGGFKIDKLIPNMVPFWTGFEMIEDGDALITYELPTKYHLTSGNEAISYELIITGITINCEKYPGLADDIDVREDILRRLARKLNNALKGTFDEGEQVKLQLRRKHTVPSAYENMIDESVVKEEESKYDHLIKKAPTIFKALKKGKISMNIDFLSDWRSQTEKKYTFDYDLGNVYIVETDPFENNYNVKILIPTIKINCDENPDLNSNQRIKIDILDKVKQKFQQFGLNIILRATKFHLKHNGTWVKL